MHMHKHVVFAKVGMLRTYFVVTRRWRLYLYSKSSPSLKPCAKDGIFGAQEEYLPFSFLDFVVASFIEDPTDPYAVFGNSNVLRADTIRRKTKTITYLYALGYTTPAAKARRRAAAHRE